MLERLKAGTKKQDLNIDFTKPEVEKSKDIERRMYSDPQESINSRVFLKFDHGKLTVIGSSMAL